MRVVVLSNKEGDRFSAEKPSHSFGEFLENLRYAGLIDVHEVKDEPERYIFDLKAPPKIEDSQEWARQNAKRMASFGYSAVAAPRWGTQ